MGQTQTNDRGELRVRYAVNDSSSRIMVVCDAPGFSSGGNGYRFKYDDQLTRQFSKFHSRRGFNPFIWTHVFYIYNPEHKRLIIHKSARVGSVSRIHTETVLIR